MDNNVKQEILENLNMEERYLHDAMRSGGLTPYKYAEGFRDAILWMLEVLGYDYCIKDDEKLGHIVYTDIVEDPDR